MEFALALRFGLLLARPGMLVAAAPVLGGAFAPVQVRIGLAMLCALLLVPAVPVPALTSLGDLTLILARELAIGLAMAMGLRAMLAGAQLGGHLTGSQLMLSYGSTIDPQGGVRSTMLAMLYGNLVLLTFLAIDGHHMLLRGLMASYTELPVGGGGIDPSIAQSVMRLLGSVFTFGVRTAAPVIVVMLIVEVGMGIVSRGAPALNLMAIGTPIRLIVGLLAIAAIVPQLPALVRRFTPFFTELAWQLVQGFR
jgi:flagellar biosynthetic protein FliR